MPCKRRHVLISEEILMQSEVDAAKLYKGTASRVNKAMRKIYR